MSELKPCRMKVFPELCGCHGGLFLEGADEVGAAGEAAFIRNFLNGQAGLAEQVFGMIQL